MVGYKLKLNATADLTFRFNDCISVVMDLEVKNSELALEIEEILSIRLNTIVRNLSKELKLHKEDFEYAREVKRNIEYWCKRVIFGCTFKMVYVVDHVEGCKYKDIPVICNGKSCKKFCSHFSGGCDCHETLNVFRWYLKPVKMCNFKKIKMWDAEKGGSEQ
jgi:hypothetical protein